MGSPKVNYVNNLTSSSSSHSSSLSDLSPSDLETLIQLIDILTAIFSMLAGNGKGLQDLLNGDDGDGGGDEESPIAKLLNELFGGKGQGSGNGNHHIPHESNGGGGHGGSHGGKGHGNGHKKVKHGSKTGYSNHDNSNIKDLQEEYKKYRKTDKVEKEEKDLEKRLRDMGVNPDVDDPGDSFKWWDTNKDGYLGKDELDRMPEHVKMNWQKYDQDGIYGLNYDEWLSMKKKSNPNLGKKYDNMSVTDLQNELKQYKDTPEKEQEEAAIEKRLRELGVNPKIDDPGDSFKWWDTNKDGYLGQDELNRMPEYVKMNWQKYDKDNIYGLSYEEWLDMRKNK